VTGTLLWAEALAGEGEWWGRGAAAGVRAGAATDVGAGGFGPGYGLASLVCHDGTWSWTRWEAGDDRIGSLLAHPFPSDEQRARWTGQLTALEDTARAAGGQEDGDVHPAVAAFHAAEDELNPAMTAGAVRPSHEGCGYYTWLVVTGEERGNLWFDPRCVDEPLAPLWHKRRRRTRFAELMEPEDLKRRLGEEQEQFAAYARTLREFAGAKDRGEWGTSRRTRAQRIAVEAAIRVNEALAEWARWAEETDLMADENFGRPQSESAQPPATQPPAAKPAAQPPAAKRDA
jgi:hypothetical protein